MLAKIFSQLPPRLIHFDTNYIVASSTSLRNYILVYLYYSRVICQRLRSVRSVRRFCLVVPQRANFFQYLQLTPAGRLTSSYSRLSSQGLEIVTIFFLHRQLICFAGLQMSSASCVPMRFYSPCPLGTKWSTVVLCILGIWLSLFLYWYVFSEFILLLLQRFSFIFLLRWSSYLVCSTNNNYYYKFAWFIKLS